MNTKIVVQKSHCESFGNGYCWSCANPYYTDHYKTKKEAVEAAKRKKL